MTDFAFLSQGGREVSFRYDLFDRNDLFKKQLYTVQECTVSYDALSELKSSARLVMADDSSVDYANDRIRVSCSVRIRAESRSFPMGTFLLSSPARSISDTVVTRDIEAYSKLQIYKDDKVESRWVVSRGTNVVNEVIRLLGTNRYRLPSSGLTLAADREWEIGTDKLTIINDLLEVINYTSLRVSPDGYFEAEPYVLPSERAVDFAYLDDRSSVIGRALSDDIDLFSVPNVFVRYVDNPDAAPLRSVYVNDNPYSPTSTVSRGRRITSCEEVRDVADQTTLDEIARRDAAAASQVYSNVTFETAIMPVHGYLNTIRLHAGGVDGIYQETAWELPCAAGAMMTHTVRKVVQV